MKASPVRALGKRNSVVFQEQRKPQRSTESIVQFAEEKAAKTPIVIHEEFQLIEQDQKMIEEAINLILDQKSHAEEEPALQNQEEEEDCDAQYERQDQESDEKNLGSSLDLIENEQKVKLIAQISEITEQLYRDQGAETGTPQRELIKQIVEQVFKNN